MPDKPDRADKADKAVKIKIKVKGRSMQDAMRKIGKRPNFPTRSTGR